MRCPDVNCGFETQQDKIKFCPTCGNNMIPDSGPESLVIICNGKLDNGSPCTAELNKSQKFCMNCGKRVDSQLFSTFGENCRECGKTFTENSLFCGECGFKREQLPATPESPKPVSILMTSFKQVKHMRLVYCIANGCTKVASSLVLYYVRLAKPADVSDEEWTLDLFLQRNKNDEMSRRLRKEQMNLLFPLQTKHTNINEWDLALLFFVLEICKIDQCIKDDIFHIKKMRNKLYHMGTTEITDTKYSYYKEKIEKYVKNCCKVLNDDSVEKEVTQTFKEVDTYDWDGKSTESLKACFYEWFKHDLILDRLTDLAAGQKVILSRIDNLEKTIITRINKGFSLLLPDPNVGLQIKNCDKKTSEQVSQQVQNHFCDNVSSEEANSPLGRAISEAKHELLAEGRTLMQTSLGCVILSIRCPTFTSLQSLLICCVYGEKMASWKRVEAILRQQYMCDDLTLDLGITHFEFWRCIEELVKGMTVAVYKEIGLDISPQFGSTIEAHSQDLVTDTEGEDAAVSKIMLTIKPTSNTQVVQIWDEIRSGRFDEKLGNVSKLMAEMYDLTELSITAYMEDNDEYEDLFYPTRRTHAGVSGDNHESDSDDARETKLTLSKPMQEQSTVAEMDKLNSVTPENKDRISSAPEIQNQSSNLSTIQKNVGGLTIDDKRRDGEEMRDRKVENRDGNEVCVKADQFAQTKKGIADNFSTDMDHQQVSNNANTLYQECIANIKQTDTTTRNTEITDCKDSDVVQQDIGSSDSNSSHSSLKRKLSGFEDLNSKKAKKSINDVEELSSVTQDDTSVRVHSDTKTDEDQSVEEFEKNDPNISSCQKPVFGQGKVPQEKTKSSGDFVKPAEYSSLFTVSSVKSEVGDKKTLLELSGGVASDKDKIPDDKKNPVDNRSATDTASASSKGENNDKTTDNNESDDEDGTGNESALFPRMQIRKLKREKRNTSANIIVQHVANKSDSNSQRLYSRLASSLGIADAGTSGMAGNGQTNMSIGSDDGEKETITQTADRIMEIFAQIAECLDEEDIVEIKTILSQVIKLCKNRNDKTQNEDKLDQLYSDFMGLLEFRSGISVSLMSQAVRSLLMIEDDTTMELGNYVYERLMEMILLEYPSLAIDMQLSDELLKVYFKLLKEASEKIQHIRVMVVGMFNVGKTTLVNRLCGKPIENVKSTVGIDIFLDSCEVKDDLDWEISDPSKKDTILNQRLQELVMKYRKPDSTQTNRPPLMDDKGPQPDPNSEPGSNNNQTFDRFSERFTKIVQSRPSGSKVMDSLKETAKPEKKELLKRRPTVSIWDFAGQAVYYSTHHFFLNARSVYIVVLDLSKNLHEKVEEDKTMEVHQNLILGNTTGYTCLDTFKFWMRSIYIYTQQKKRKENEFYKPKIVLVGTFKDKISVELLNGRRLEQYKEDYFNEALQHFITPIIELVHDRKFLINNKDFSEQSKNDFLDIKREIFHISKNTRFWNEIVPAKFIPLERAVFHSRHQGKNIMQFSELQDVGKDVEFPLSESDEIVLFLKFQHAFGNVLYYNTDNFNEMVILTPQWIIDAFKAFVTHTPNKQATQLESWIDFEKFGKLSNELISELLSDDKFRAYKEQIVKYMEHLDVIAKPVEFKKDYGPTNQSDQTEVNSQSLDGTMGNQTEKADFYIMPCMLPQRPETEKLKTYFSGADTTQTPTLCLFIKKGLLPSFVFHCLIATFLKEKPITVSSSTKLLFNGLGSFNLNDSCTRQMTIWSVDNIIHLRITFKSKSTSETCDERVAFCKDLKQKFIALVLQIFSFHGKGTYADENKTDLFDLKVKCPKCPEQVPFDGIDCTAGRPYYDYTDRLLNVDNLLGDKENEVICCCCNETVTASEALQYWFDLETRSPGKTMEGN